MKNSQQKSKWHTVSLYPLALAATSRGLMMYWERSSPGKTLRLDELTTGGITEESVNLILSFKD